MGMHQIDYKVMRTGSRLFDIVMINAAKRICTDLPGISYEVAPKEIRITGELNDEDYAKYEKFMFGGDELYEETL